MSVLAATVGVVKYPEPLIVTVTLAIEPLRTVHVAVAFEPEPLVNTIVGAVVYPTPPFSIVTLAT